METMTARTQRADGARSPSVEETIVGRLPGGDVAWSAAAVGICLFLQLRDLRALSVCGRFTTWEWLVPQCQGIMRAFLRSMLARARASRECPKPVWGWKEENPICASPLCGGYTGLWLPSQDELKEATGADREFMCGSSIWGSSTIRSELEIRRWENARTRGRTVRSEPCVACSIECGRFLKEIAQIRGYREMVIVASGTRVTPEKLQETRDEAGPRRERRIPEAYLLLSELQNPQLRFHRMSQRQPVPNRTRSASPLRLTQGGG